MPSQTPTPNDDAMKVNTPSDATTDKSKTAKKRRWRSGTVAKREIRKLSRTTRLIVPKSPFTRLVKEITQDLGHIRWKADALNALQEAAEIYVTEGFMRANTAMQMSGRKTLSVKDTLYSNIAI